MKKEIIRETESYVRQLLQKLPGYLTYHNLDHTVRVVESVLKITGNYKLTRDEKEVLILGAWFHDTGFLNTYKGHEEESKRMAIAFLKSKNYPTGKIKMVTKCIEATKIDHQPEDVMERIIRDADLYHLANADYFNILDLLKKECEYVCKAKITNESWYTQNLHFLTAHRYHTAYCQSHLKNKKQENLFKNLQKVATYKCSI